MLAWHSRGADRCRKPKSSESSYAQIGYSYSDSTSTSLPIPPPPPLDDGDDDDDGDEKGDNDSDSSHSEQVDEEELLEREGRKYGIRGFCDLRRRDEADAPTADDAPERSSRSDRRRERPRHKHQSTDESYELLTARGSESKGALPTDADCMDWTDWPPHRRRGRRDHRDGDIKLAAHARPRLRWPRHGLLRGLVCLVCAEHTAAYLDACQRRRLPDVPIAPIALARFLLHRRVVIAFADLDAPCFWDACVPSNAATTSAAVAAW